MPQFDDILDDLTAGIFSYPTPEVWSGDGVVRTDDQMKEWAAKENCTYEEADDHTLFLDLDSEEAFTTFKDNIKLADRLFNIDKRPASWLASPSKSGLPKRHVRVHLRGDFTLMERILLQACLGSDLKREMISMLRARAGEKNVVVFFERKLDA